jgi:hypothetical protein
VTQKDQDINDMQTSLRSPSPFCLAKPPLQTDIETFVSPAIPHPWHLRRHPVARFEAALDPQQDRPIDTSPTQTFFPANNTGFDSSQRLSLSDSEDVGILGLGGFEGWTTLDYRDDLEMLEEPTTFSCYLTPRSYFDGEEDEDKIGPSVSLTQGEDVPLPPPAISVPDEDPKPSLIFTSPTLDMSRVRRVTYEHAYEQERGGSRADSSLDGSLIYRKEIEIDKKWAEEPGCLVQ